MHSQKIEETLFTTVRYNGLTRIGLDHDALKEKYPKLVYANYSGFGLKGPDADDVLRRIGYGEEEIANLHSKKIVR